MDAALRAARAYHVPAPADAFQGRQRRFPGNRRRCQGDQGDRLCRVQNEVGRDDPNQRFSPHQFALSIACRSLDKGKVKHSKFQLFSQVSLKPMVNSSATWGCSAVNRRNNSGSPVRTTSFLTTSPPNPLTPLRAKRPDEPRVGKEGV